MKLTFYGRLRDSVGAHDLDCSVPATILDTESLRAWIGAEHPALLDPTVRLAIDDVLVVGSASLSGASEIAFLPPVSGG